MSDSLQPYKAETASQSPDAQLSNNEVKIMITPPTPLIGAPEVEFVAVPGPVPSDDDTHKEAIAVDRSAEEKQVWDPDEVSEKKLDHFGDEKEVYVPEIQVSQPWSADPTEKEVHAARTWGCDDEKELVPMQDQFTPTQHMDMSEKEIYIPGAHDPEEDEISPVETKQSTESGNGPTKSTNVVYRQLNNMNQAVDKRKKALATFTSESNTRMREGYNRLERRVTDGTNAIEQGATDRYKSLEKGTQNKYKSLEKGTQNKYKSLEKGVTNQLNRIEQGTTTRYANMEKGLNDQVSRAGKAWNTKVAALKQGVSNVKKVGSKPKAVTAEEAKETV